MDGAQSADVTVQQHSARQTVETEARQDGMVKSPSEADFNQRDADSIVVEDLSNNAASQPPLALETPENQHPPVVDKLHEQSPFKE